MCIRDSLNPLEEAYAMQRLIDEFNLTHEDVAKSLGKSRSGVSNTLRLINLDIEVAQMLSDGKIEMGHARALLGAESDRQLSLANIVLRQALNQRPQHEMNEMINLINSAVESGMIDENGDGVRKAEVELFFDGGIRRGEDIVKAHALGASAACSGRCWFWGLAANGEQGVTDVLDLLNQETKDALSLIGQQKLADVGEHNLYKP